MKRQPTANTDEVLLMLLKEILVSLRGIQVELKRIGDLIELGLCDRDSSVVRELTEMRREIVEAINDLNC